MGHALNKYEIGDSDVGCTKTYWECLANYYANSRNFNILSISHSFVSQCIFRLCLIYFLLSCGENVAELVFTSFHEL